VATKIKLMRIGKMREPHYRIVVADARTKRDGRSIEAVGEYHPKDDPSTIKVDSDRVQYWLGVGAQPTESVAAILRVTGDWQRFKGLPAPEPMKMAAPRPDRRAAFEEAAREGLGGSSGGGGDATTPRKRAPRAAPKAETPKAETPKAETPKAETPKAETPKAEPAPAEEAPATTPAAAPTSEA
jgi:small subunit ribosomal protein S16